jgi:hypothetical protein
MVGKLYLPGSSIFSSMNYWYRSSTYTYTMHVYKLYSDSIMIYRGCYNSRYCTCVNFTANQECASANQCSHGCAIVHGRQQCYCPLGFELSQSGTQCFGMASAKSIITRLNYSTVNFERADVNECSRNPCHQLCVNTRGSFECDCMSGFELQPDEKTCQGNGY